MKAWLVAVLAGAAVVAVLVSGCGGHRRHEVPGPPRPVEHALYEDGPNGRYLLSAGWSSRADPRDIGLREGWQRPGAVAGFRPVGVPNAFNTGPLTPQAFRSRVQWYRVRFLVPRLARTSGWRLRFEAVSGRADVFFGGRRVGTNRLAFLPFEVPLPHAKPGSNEVVVRVDGRRGATPLPPASRPAGWWNYGGIVREVYLRRVFGFDLRNLHVVTAPGSPSRVRVSAEALNAGERARRSAWSLALRGPGGLHLHAAASGPFVGPARAARIRLTLTVPHARLWGPGHPWLYRLRLRLAGGQVTTQEMGIRRLDVSDGRLLLNGRRLSLRGVSFHEISATRGSALGASDRARLVADVRALGADAAREHYPPHPALLEAFDRLGIVFWEQVPVWRLAGEELGPHALRPAALAAVRRTLMRDRNHASAAVLSVSNETLRGGANEAGYLAAAERTVHRLAPGTIAAADIGLTPLRAIPASYSALDAIGFNSYVGWYGSAPPSALGADLDAARAAFPRQALVVTEVGAEATRSGPASEKGTYAFQRAYLARELSIIDSRRYLSGALVWALRDFPVRPDWTGGNPRPRPPFNAKGLMQADGRRKPAFGAVRRMFLRALAGSA